MKSSCEGNRRHQPSDPQQHQQEHEQQHNTTTTKNHPNHDHVIYGPISPDNPYKNQIEEMRRELNEPCQTCLYTGVSVCMGLSLYFANLAIDESTLVKNRRFLWICSAGSVLAGTYRWYLG